MAKPHKIKNVSADDPLEDVVERILGTRLKEFYSHWPDPQRPATFEQIHDLRIAGKRLRYSAESLRELYSDQLSLLIDILKRSQDLLGEIQDCVTQRHLIEADLKRMKQQKKEGSDLSLLEKIIAEYDERQAKLYTQFREIWRGMTIKQFRRSLKMMVSDPSQ